MCDSFLIIIIINIYNGYFLLEAVPGSPILLNMSVAYCYSAFYMNLREFSFNVDVFYANESSTLFTDFIFLFHMYFTKFKTALY